MTNPAFVASPCGDVSPGATMLSAASTPSGSSPAPATTNVGGCAPEQGRVYEKPYSTGSPGGRTTGATFVRAMGLTPSTNSPHPSRTAAYSPLNAANPGKLNGAGDRTSIPHSAAFGRPAAARCPAIRSNPAR